MPTGERLRLPRLRLAVANVSMALTLHHCCWWSAAIAAAATLMWPRLPALTRGVRGAP